MIKNTDNSYGSIVKFFHWTMAIILLCLLTIGYWLKDLGIPALYKAHKAIGFLILLLVVARLLWRFANITPKYDESLPKWMINAGNMMHYCLYALMIIVPFSAFIASNAKQYPVSFLFLFDMPSLFKNADPELAKQLMEAHSITATILLWAVIVHAAAALYHHFIKKDNILQRMLPFKINKH